MEKYTKYEIEKIASGYRPDEEQVIREAIEKDYFDAISITKRTFDSTERDIDRCIFQDEDEGFFAKQEASAILQNAQNAIWAFRSLHLHLAGLEE